MNNQELDFDFDDEDVNDAEQEVNILNLNLQKRNWDKIWYSISATVLAFQEVRNAMKKTVKQHFEELIRKITKVFEKEKQAIAKQYGDGFSDKLNRKLRDILGFLNK